MAQSARETVTEIVNGQRGQSVLLPENFRFSKDHVYLKRDSDTGVVSISERPFVLASEKPLKPSWEDIFRAFDEAGAHDFEVERDRSLPRDVEL